MSNTRTLTPGQRARLAALGVNSADAGRLFNRAASPINANTADRVTIPDDPAQLEEMLADGKKVQALFKNGQFGDFINKYAGSVLNKQQEINAQIRDQVNSTLAQWLKDNEPENIKRLNLDAAQPVVAQRADRNKIYNARAMGASIDKEFEGSADYFRSIWHNTSRDANLQAKLHRVKNAFSSVVPSEGGFLIPETLRAELLEVALETAIVRPRARVIPMESLRVPFPMIDATSNVASVFGGIVGYWTEEGAALTASSASFARVVLDAKKLTAYTEVPNELIADSIGSFEAFIDRIFPEALAWYEDDAFLNGSGVGMPLGVLDANNAATVEVAKEATQSADTIVWENVIKMYARMLPGSLNRAVWIVSPDTFPELATMALSVGTGGSAVWLNNGVQGPPMTILGRPVIVSEKVPILGDAGDINFIDFGHYLIGDRQVMSAQSSEHYKFGNDVTAYRIIERVDGRPWLNSAITPKNGGPSMSPFVKVAARA